jgi:hypothetical protein
MARAKSGNGLAGRTSYDRFKEFQGKRYTGMAVGRGHKWKYDSGDWTEKKVTPDKWEIHYAVNKHRKGRAPEGSGAPVGTSHHWYILADQVVTKLDANTYSTELKGTKYKLAHKRADRETWSASDRAQRRRLVQVLREMIDEIERAPSEDTAPAPVNAERHRSSATPRVTVRRGPHRRQTAA